MRGSRLAGSPRLLLVAVVGATCGGLALVIGIRRVLGGDERVPNLYLIFVLFVIFSPAIAILRDRRISDRRARFFRAVLIRPLPPVTDYRPKPDPRRTRRQRFIELFDPDIDRSDEPARRYGSVGPVVAIAGLVGGILFDAVVFSLPLLSIWWIYPGAIGLCIIGVVWIWLGAAGGIRMELDAREKGTGAQVSA